MDISPTINSVHGRIFTHVAPDPDANNEFLITVPPRRRWRLFAITISFVTDANAANRNVSLAIDDGTNFLYRLRTALNHTASLTRNHIWHQAGIPEFTTVTDFMYPIPIITLAAGSRITSETSNLQAGDNFASPKVLIEEWIDP